MAVAVKNEREVASSGLLDRLPAVSLAGTVYLLGCLGIVFYLLPSLWWMGWDPNSFTAKLALGVVMLAAATGLVFLGARLLGPKSVPGVRAGIFMGFLGFVVVLLLARWVSLWVEYWVYENGWFGGNGPTAGAVICAVVAVVLLLLLVRLFFRPGFERFLLRLEGQGWFSAKAFKPLQGQKVRRGTIFGILVLVGAGIYTMITHGTLARGPRDWELLIPFTGRVVVTNPGDLKDLPAANAAGQVVVDRFALKDLNSRVDPARFVKVFLPNDAATFKTNEIVPRDAFNAEVTRLKNDGLQPPKGVDPVPATGDLTYSALTLLPALRFTVPLLLLAVSLWLAWRIVNMPAFADFLIATEAELNKVSWTTQKRLIQDTIVVLVTVVLMAVFLFAMDQGWRVLLSWKPIGVLQIPEDQPDNNANVEQRPW